MKAKDKLNEKKVGTFVNAVRDIIRQYINLKNTTDEKISKLNKDKFNYIMNPIAFLKNF